MAILVNSGTKVIVQGITGKAGSMHARTMIEYGTKIVAGVRPGSEGQSVNGVPVYDTVKKAMAETGADTSIIFVPPAAAKAPAIEAIEAGIGLLVMTPEHVPLHDVLEILVHARAHGTTVIGPNTAGLIAPSARCKVGFVPNSFFAPGPVGMASRSGTLMYELSGRLTKNGIGQSTCVGVGGDPVVGARFADIMKLFERDDETKAILLVGEIGGTQEEEAAALVESGGVTKPVIAYIAGLTAPEGKRMGHAGALVTGDKGTIQNKLKAFDNAGIRVAGTLGEATRLISELVGK